MFVIDCEVFLHVKCIERCPMSLFLSLVTPISFLVAGPVGIRGFGLGSK